MSFLKLKEVEQFDLDDPKRTLLHREIILKKPFLRKLYIEWYQPFVNASQKLPKGKIVELGSGGGFLKDILPQIITSDILPLEINDMTFSALDMPFENESLAGIFMIDVFHHIPDSELFLQEASRTLKKGGKIIMSEPCNSIWGRLIYQNFHHEPFNPDGDWKIPSSGPMSDANGALPWIVFERDRKKFNKLFPNLRINRIQYHTPLRYLLSGGVSMKQLVPNWSFGFFTLFEKALSPIARYFSMFVEIEIEKVD